MTYCIGMLLNQGLVLMADTRTNAGVDNFSSFKKLHTLADTPNRQIFACTSGSLSMSQAVISLIREGLPAIEEGGMMRTLNGATSMFRAAQLISSSVSLLLGGRIGKGAPALFLIYPAGNFIECKSEVPFLQIGETKYGKPILDRGLALDTPLPDAVKVGFLSYDSAMHSNLGVARPIDIMVMPNDPKRPLLQHRVEADDAYFNDLSLRWSRLLHEGTLSIPNPPFMGGDQ
jgi:putative proteasome-type protease